MFLRDFDLDLCFAPQRLASSFFISTFSKVVSDLLTFFVHSPDLEMCFVPHQRALLRSSGRQKVVRTCGVFTILTWICASRHNGVHFFNIWTSKSGPNARHVLYILTWKCASRYNGVRFFDSSTSRSGAEPGVFCTF